MSPIARRLVGAMTAALSDRAKLDALAPLVDALPPGALASLGITAADVALCFEVHGAPVPAIAKEPSRAPERPSSDLDELTAWARASRSSATPEHAAVIAGLEEALLRATGCALIAARLDDAAALLRWLATRGRAASWKADFHDALASLLYRVHHATDALETALHGSAALAVSRLTYRQPPAQLPADPAPIGPDVEAREQLTERGVRWLREHLAIFVAAPPSDLRGELLAVKAAGELALLARLLLRSTPAHAELGRTVLAETWRMFEHGDRIANLVEREPGLVVFASGYVSFVREGMRSSRFETALERALATTPAIVAPLVADAAQRIGLALPPSLEAAASQSSLANARPPWEPTPRDAYLITHEVFSFTDLGREPLAIGRDYLRRWFPVWTHTFARVGGYDLLAEMITAGHCADVGCATPAVWRTLAAAQLPDGRVPFSGNHPTEAAGGDYHSTLMALMAALSCQHGVARG